MMRLAALCAGVLVCGFAAAAAARGAASLPLLHPDAQLNKSVSTMRNQGLPLKLRSFRVDRAVAEVARWYHDQWGDAVAESEFQGWKQLSVMQGTRFVTVQLKPSAGSPRVTQGRLMISALEQVRPGSRAPGNPADATIGMDLDLDLGDSQSRVLLYQTQLDPYTALAQETQEWERRGFQVNGRPQPYEFAGAMHFMQRLVRGRSTVSLLAVPEAKGALVFKIQARGVNL